jgi:DNA (cytosine-5)-methyltransferase 1
MNVLSLFSGIGGLELGLERAGMTVAGQVEIDPFCRAVLARHWPEVPKHDDVCTTVDWWRSGPRPRVDVVAGGFPCQPVSSAGRKLAQEDPRWLWPAFATVIRDLRPRYAILENVPGLLGRGVGDVLGDLAAIGYDAEWDCIPAAAVGAPHLRYRWFCVAYPTGEGSPDRASGTGGGSGEALRLESERLGGEMAHTTGDGRRQGWSRGPVGHGTDRKTQPTDKLADTDSGGRPGRPGIFRAGRRGQPADSGWWATEPDVGRVAHGVPKRVDRLRGLGNAVVPQVSEYVGRLVMASEERAA